MPLEVHVPFFSDLVSGGFSCGANYLVEFEPDSLWYETSLAIATQAMRSGVRTQYHTFMHVPGEVRQELQRLNSDLKKLESEDKFRLIDSFTSLTGLPIQPETAGLTGGSERKSRQEEVRFEFNDPSFLEHFTQDIAALIQKGAREKDKQWLHIDDNTSIFNRYFKEPDVLNIFHTRVFQLTRFLDLCVFHSVVTGVWSDSFYKQFEAQCDGVIDFKAEDDDEDGKLENYVRVRTLRGRSINSQWRHLRLERNGEIILDKPHEDKKKDVGISGWLKGPKKK
jgi:KaiC/GvpD/RAD55 family RecA-like ATPase